MIVRYLLTLLSVITFSFHQAHGQFSLEGAAADQHGSVIPYATVSVAGPDSAVISVVQSDSLGRFAFGKLSAQDYRLSVYSLGFAKKTLDLRIRKDTFVHIRLLPLKGALSEVTVMAKKPVVERKADRIIYHVAGSVNAAGSNGLEILKKAPGISVNDKTITLAGSGAPAIMVNGRLLHLSGKALLDYLKSFSSSQISRIEIITHPSAQYDAEGNAGLVNIITRESAEAGLSGNIEGSVKRFFYKDQPDYNGIKNYGDIDGSTGLNYNHGNWSAYANLSYSAGREIWGYGIDVYYPGKHWAMKDTGEYRIATLNALAGVDYALNGRTTIGFEYNYIYHMEGGADYVRVPVYNNAGQPDSSFRTYATYYPVARSNAFNGHLIQKLNNAGATLTLNADYFNSYRNDKSNLVSCAYTGKGELMEDGVSRLYDTTMQNIRIYTVKADVVLPTSFAKFSLGSKMSFIDNYSNIYYYHKTDGGKVLDPGLSNEFRYIENTQALYVNASKDMDSWKVDAGLRAEVTETKAVSYFENTKLRRSYLKLFPSLLLSYRINDDHDLSFSYSKRIDRPTFWNLNPYKTFMTPYTYVEGNPYLEPEYATNIQLSHRYKGLITSSLYMQVTGNGFARVIRTHTEGLYTHTTTMANFFRSYRYGISESLSLQPLPWLETSDQLTGYYTKVSSEVPYINGIDGWGLYGQTNNTFHFNRDKTFNGFLGFWYQFPQVDHFGRSDAYYNVDLGLELLAVQKKLALSLNYNDVFQSSASKVYTTVDQVKNIYTDFQLNSRITFSASWNFGNGHYTRKHISGGNEIERNRTN